MFRIICLAALIVACDSKKSEPSKSAEPSKPAETAPDKPAETKPAESPAPIANPRCEALRDKYLAWQADRVKGALGATEGEMRAQLQAQADKELAIAKDKFVGACSAMGPAFDESCLVKDTMRTPRETRDRCRKMMHELDKHMFAR